MNQNENTQEPGRNNRESEPVIVIVRALWKNIKIFDIGKVVATWWRNEQQTAKIAFLGALIIGFVSHLFVYTGRYYGRDDSLRTYYNRNKEFMTGRWFHKISDLTYSYVLPLVSGILVSFFLAVAAFYVCKLFKVQKKFNAILIAGLMATFPSIANTNLFLYETTSYHFMVMLGVLAVYIVAKSKFGLWVIGSIFLMLILATYQAKFNVFLALSLFYLIFLLLDTTVDLKDILRYVLKLVVVIGFGAQLYIISITLAAAHYGVSAFNDYRGFSQDSFKERFSSISGIINALQSTYKNFFDGFFGNIYLIVKELKQAYIGVFLLSFLFLLIMVISKKLYKQPLRFISIFILFVLVPLACNFSGFFDALNEYGLMIYAFVLFLVFTIIMCEQCVTVWPILKSVFVLSMVFIIGNYIVGNNVYYLKAYVYNQRTFSLTNRILNRMDSLIPLSDSNEITFFGGLPNEYYRESWQVFREYGTISDGSALGSTSFINYGIPNNTSLALFALAIDGVHGVNLKALQMGEKRDYLANEIMNRNMPAWPAEGSVNIIDGVIVINFGLTDVVWEESEGQLIFRARHYVSERRTPHQYEYRWQVYKNGTLIDSPVTNSDRLYMDMPEAGDSYKVTVTVSNTTVNFSYPNVSREFGF